MPELTKFYNENQDKRDKFEAFAFHDSRTAKSWAELEPHLGPVKKEFWDGKDLPFPILFDNTGETVKTWGIFAFPTFVLIDPDGKVVRNGSLKMLEEKLKASK